MPVYCVTGGTGLIASSLVRELLSRGHTVRATVRDPEDAAKVGFLQSMEGARERLQLVKADLLVDGSFDDAVDGADGVFHTASPVSAAEDENAQQTLIDVAIEGTRNVMKSCSKASSVRRVVLTSSISSIRYRYDATVASPLNESHWSDIEYFKRYKLWYAYSKTLAEKEAWRLAENFGVNLVVVNPSFVVGPIITPQPTSSLHYILGFLKGHFSECPNRTMGFVHIDDVVFAHILAMEDSRASGRLICSNSVVHWSEILEMIRANYPSYPVPSKCSDQDEGSKPHSVDTAKIRSLGLPRFKTLPQMFDDCIKSFQEKGFL
ncbi:tetraketide alpha-pyrone reductase 2 isoform X2 [Canna indica]|uniref:Tetraketide alpha-pyrone reductase 2 isoform X2 n=1 Tax=Canna indica TaxID=4628 RepID=A0AAQ3Q8A7_9LILI|nr:tetraketide alpha-pyrone reductase 2 isoform X2 [Canna indica]